ncbi:MAG: hypothetical protein KatS3mg002_0635 [Candidatus Woesearchaeota archaeon]|nr:MAG: hypothetical protein KatS3mg002_0635 [Candidatus Woesearchaeota archaeon]
MNINKIDLLKKGWSIKEIEDASKIIQKAEDNKLLRAKVFDKTIYWASLFLIIVGNIICSTFLIPFAFALKGFAIVLIVAVTGFTFGVLFSILILDIIKTERQFMKGLLVTLLTSGIINFALISRVSIEFSLKTMLPLRYNPYIIAGIYLLSFLTPHIVVMITQKSTTK